MILNVDQRMAVDAIRSRTDIVALVSGYLPLKRVGRRYWACCPFHQERSPSFEVCPDRQTWHCFGACGTGGDVFSFVMKADGVDFAEALRRLDVGDLVARNMTYQRPPDAPRAPAAWLKDAERYVTSYCQTADRYSAWQAYKPLSRATIDRYELGVGVLPEFSSACQHRRLIVPSRVNGAVVALAGRELGCGCEARYRTKWANAKDSEVRLFNENELRPGAAVIVCENRADALLAMEQWPDVVAVALGTAKPKHDTAEVIAASSPRRVMVWLDNDPAGNPNHTTWRRHRAEMESKGLVAQTPGAVALVTALRRLGVWADRYHWPEDTEAKYDLGRWLAELAGRRRLSA